ncbi:uncharacterized protein LOC103388080 [Cynoglossus semilaevis]|uniref:uncharacterized protein LOC103388080 n=1 Tax=Cynoglossus semilaevis TaxID=244447 RepID=UPI00049559E0|nr:uncharacterized protein LOC103388080 [Cynoglossus semilaevis]
MDAPLSEEPPDGHAAVGGSQLTEYNSRPRMDSSDHLLKQQTLFKETQINLCHWVKDTNDKGRKRTAKWKEDERQGDTAASCGRSMSLRKQRDDTETLQSSLETCGRTDVKDGLDLDQYSSHISLPTHTHTHTHTHIQFVLLLVWVWVLKESLSGFKTTVGLQDTSSPKYEFSKLQKRAEPQQHHHSTETQLKRRRRRRNSSTDVRASLRKKPVLMSQVLVHSCVRVRVCVHPRIDGPIRFFSFIHLAPQNSNSYTANH